MTWQEEAASLRKTGMSFGKIAERVGKSKSMVYEAVRRAGGLQEPTSPAELEEIVSEEMVLGLLGKKSGMTEEQILKTTGMSKSSLDGMLDSLRSQGFLVDSTLGQYRLIKGVYPEEPKTLQRSWNGETIVRFGVASDTHMGSKHQQLTHLNTAYDIFASEGIDTVYHPGDISEGSGMRKGHEFEIFAHGADAQSSYIIKNYPRRKGVRTLFITGNHDHTHIKNGGHDIGIPIADKRDDMEYLGINTAKIALTPNCVLELNHGLDGSSYAISYTIQRAIDSLSSDQKPNIFINGHHHKAMYVFYRSIHAFEAGCFESQTPWMKGKRISAHMGAWILEAHVNGDGEITRLKKEFIPFYKTIENDY